MFEVKIKLDYNDKTFTSKPVNLKKEELESLIKKVEDIVRTKAEYLTLEDWNGTHFFGAEILSKSIISLLIKDIS